MIISSIIATVATMAATAMGFTGAVAVGVSSVLGTIGAAIIYGGIALLASSTKKAEVSSATYEGTLQTQTNQNLPIPLLYGTCKLAGNRIWQDENAQSDIKRIVAFAEGEICDYSEIKLNDIPINEISGISIKEYYGTDEQTVDPIVGGSTQSERCGLVGSLKNVAYLAITVPRNSQIDINYNLTAIVKGRKIRVYSSLTNYELMYSENPAWVMLDFLTSYNGLGLCLNNYGNIDQTLLYELFDIQSFIEAAAFCDETIPTQSKDENGNIKTEYLPRFTFNMIFDAQTSARNLRDEIYRSCRGGLFIKNGKLQFKIDKAEPVSEVFDEEDIIKGSETFQTIPKEEHYDILKCTYISPKHEWQKVEATAEIPVYKDGIPIEHNINIYSCTNFQQASRLAWYYVNSKILQPYFGSFKTDYRAFDIEVGDVISFSSILMGLTDYKVKVTSLTDNGAGIYTINWRTYDERLYSDEKGSKEPKVLVSHITDKYQTPDDISGFNVVQSNNLFNFVWNKNIAPKDTYEIRIGENWDNATVLKTGIIDNFYNCKILAKGLYKFWIKAYNGYNYSKNAVLDVFNVDSIPNINEILKIDILKALDGTYDENIKIYQNTLKLKNEQDLFWQSQNSAWGTQPNCYQNGKNWGTKVVNKGVYQSQVYDTTKNLDCIITCDQECICTSKENNAIIEWCYSSDNENYTNWTLVNSGQYKFRYCKFKITLNSYDNVQTVLSKLVMNLDVPDKELDMQVEITDSAGLKVEYDFINSPSIVATVNDDNNAYIVITEKTNKYAIVKAYTNNGALCTAKLSLRIKGY